MVSCEVIADLMPLYLSGEASAQTKLLVAEHLATCPSCRQMFEAQARYESTIKGAESLERRPEGQTFISRTRRVMFALGVGGAFAFACIIAVVERVFVKGMAGMSIPTLPGPEHLWVVAALLLTATYTASLKFRVQPAPAGSTNSKRRIAISSVLLFMAGTATFHILINGQALSALVCLLALLSALLITFGRLPRLPYGTVAVLIALLLTGAFLLGQTVAAIVMVGDYAFDRPHAMGHPPDDVGLEEAAKIDLQPLGLQLAETAEVRKIGGAPIDSLSEAVRVRYQGNGQEVYLTLVKSRKAEDAQKIYQGWKTSVESGVQICQFEVDVPGLLEEGHVYRTYSAMIDRAFSVWQTDKWIIIIEATGSFAEASKLTKRVREIVESDFEEHHTT